MKAVVAPQPDGARGACARRAAGADARARRSADPGRRGRRQPARRPAAARALSAAAGRARHPRPRDRRARSSRRARARSSLIGQPVCALVAGGGYAEYCVAPVGHLPAGARRRCRWSKRRRCPRRCSPSGPICSSAASRRTATGCWSMAAPAASARWRSRSASLFGLNVIVTCGSDEKCARAVELGAAACDQLPDAGFRRGGRGADRRQGRRGRARHGRRRLCAAQPRLPRRRWPARLDRGPARRQGRDRRLPDIMRRRLTLTGSTLRPRSVEFKTMVADEIARTVWPYVEGGRLKPVIDTHLPARRGGRRACADGERASMSARSCFEVGG